MFILLWGNDSYRATQVLKKMKAKFIRDRDPQQMNITTIDAVKTEAARIWESMLAVPFLAEKRMLIIHDLFSAKKKEVHETLLTRLEADTLPKDCIYIFVEQSTSWRTKAAKAITTRLKAEPYAQHYDLLSGHALTQWIEKEIQTRGGQIERSAAQYLSQALSNDMWQLHQVLNQALAAAQAAGKTSIDRASLNAFVDHPIDDNIFTLIDAILQGKRNAVFPMIRAHYAQGKDPMYIFAMILRQFRILLQLSDLQNRGRSLQDKSIAKEVGLHPFVIKKSLPLLTRYPLKKIRTLYERLFDIDRNIKTGQADQSLLIDVFVARVSLS